MDNFELLNKIAENFYQNIHALRIFNEQIGGIAEQHDKTTLREFISGFSQVVGLPEDELNPEKGGSLVNVKIRIPKIEDLENLEPDNQDEKDDNKPMEADKTITAQEDDKKEVVIDDPEKAVEFIQFMENSKKKFPYQTRLLRQGALINLVIFYETLVGGLLQYFYLQNPSALPSDGRVLSLADLREIGSIENAEKFLIDKEIDSIMREGTRSQLDAFNKRSKVNLDAFTEYLPELIEVSQRRNLFVHNNGICEPTAHG